MWNVSQKSPALLHSLPLPFLGGKQADIDCFFPNKKWKSERLTFGKDDVLQQVENWGLFRVLFLFSHGSFANSVHIARDSSITNVLYFRKVVGFFLLI